MPRKPRVQFAGALLHVWARRVERWPLFVDDDDYRRYISLLAQTVEEFGWILLSFCLMPNHVHLLVELREPNLSAGMKHLHGRYVRYYNDRHNRDGSLFEHRFHSRLVADEVYFATLVSYIESNPVKAAISATPDEWPWSSRGICALGPAPPWLAADELASYRTEPKDGTWFRL